MLTMQPVIGHGRTTWDRRLLPPDEFEERRLDVDAICARLGLRAIIGFDDAPAPGLAAYLTNYRGGLATVIAVPGMPTVLLAGLGGARDHAFIKTVCCIEDLRWYPALGRGVRTVLGEAGLRSGPVGLVGDSECLPARMHHDVLESLGPLGVRHIDSDIAELRRRKSVRELAILDRCSAVLAEARSAAERALHDRGSLHRSLVAAERAARAGGCRDVRILAAARTGSLSPWPSPVLQPDTWQDGWAAIYLAAEYLGYWGDLGFSVTGPGCPAPQDPQPLLEAARSALRPGATGPEVAANAAAAADAETEVLVDIAGAGLRPAEAPLLTASPAAVARAGDVISMSVITKRRGIIGLGTSRMVVPAGDAAGTAWREPGRADWGMAR
jgi:hypothetical protein